MVAHYERAGLPEQAAPYYLRAAVVARRVYANEEAIALLQRGLALLRRSPVTAELTIYSLIFFIPLGIVSGVNAARRKDRVADHRFRLAAFLASSWGDFICGQEILVDGGRTFYRGS